MAGSKGDGRKKGRGQEEMGEDGKEGKKRKKEVRSVIGTVQVYISCTVMNELDYTPCKDRRAHSVENKA